MNITDVGHLTNDDIADSDGEDKIGKKAKLSGKTAQEIADFYAEKFIEDEKFLRILPPDGRPKATEYIQEQIDIAQTLIDRDFAYEVDGSVYFRVNRFAEYGKLSGNSLENLNAGARIEVNDEKESPLDFALWKKAEPEHLMQWKSPWGMGFPGWHIECSAMSRAYFGDQFDIHTGGEDNLFPHHECEIAQNECSCAEENHGKNSVNYWLHAKHLLLEGQKMSKSKGNFYTIRDLAEKGWKGEEIRYLLLSAHYRTSLNFTLDGLTQARNSIARIEEARRIFSEIAKGSKSQEKFPEIDEYIKKYQTALFDDLNVSDALAVVFELIKYGLKLREDKKLNAERADYLLKFLETDFDQIFDIFPEKKELDPETIKKIESLIKKRSIARGEKDWQTSDEIRDQLLTKFGVEILDQSGNTTWRIKNS